jgi:hypothetical protein
MTVGIIIGTTSEMQEFVPVVRLNLIHVLCQYRIPDIGKWSREEEAELTRIVMQLKQDYPVGQIFWSKVSDQMGGKRGRQQCQEKWYVLRKYPYMRSDLVSLKD